MTDNAGYCMAVTAKRDGMRLLAIVLGEENGKVRNQETSELLDYGYNLYELETIKKKGENKKNYKTDVRLNDLKLPISSGSEIGKLIVLDDVGNQIDKVTVTVTKDIKKDNFLNLFSKLLLSSIIGNI